MEESRKEKEALHLSLGGKIKKASTEEENVEDNNRLGIFDYIAKKGYSDIVSLTSFLFMPYVVGLIFVFIVVAGLNPMIFMYVLNVNALFSTWAIGYEILGVVLFFWAVKVLLSSYMDVREHNLSRNNRLKTV